MVAIGWLVRAVDGWLVGVRLDWRLVGTLFGQPCFEPLPFGRKLIGAFEIPHVRIGDFRPHTQRLKEIQCPDADADNKQDRSKRRQLLEDGELRRVRRLPPGQSQIA